MVDNNTKTGNEPDALLDALLALRDELRAVGFDPGLQRVIAAQRLLVRMAVEGKLPNAQSEWRDWLAPIFCGTAAQQTEFDLRYQSWVDRYPVEPFATQNVSTRTGSAASLVSSRVSRQVVWRDRLDRLRHMRFIIPTIIVLLFLAILSAWWITEQRNTSNTITESRQGSAPITQVVDPDQGRRSPGPTPTATPTPSGPQAPTILPTSPILKPWQVLIIALPLLLWVLWQILAWWLQRSWLKRMQSRRLPRLEELRVEGAEHKHFATVRDRRLLVELRRPRSSFVVELDVVGTVRETARSGGLFSPTFGLRRLAPEYLFLIDREVEPDQQARLADELLLQMKENGLYVDPFYFQRDARLCQSATEPLSPAVSLGHLAGRYSDHRLVIFTDGDGFTDHYSGAPQKWLNQFATWQQRAVLTPESPEHWGACENNLNQAGFLVLPASTEGIEELGRWLNNGRIPTPVRRSTNPYPLSIVERPGRWFERRQPPPEEVEPLLKEIHDYLGKDEWRWLLACAVYPELTWDLTLYHGFALFGNNEEWLRDWTTRLLRLVRLPWFRQSWMPDWLRQRLVDQLNGPDQETVRLTIDRLLRSAVENPEQSVPLQIAQPERLTLWDRLKRHWEWLKIRKGVTGANPKEPLRDYVFLNFMAGGRNRLGVSLPEIVRRLIYRDGMPAFGIRPVLSFAVTILVMISVAYGLISVNTSIDPQQMALRLPLPPTPNLTLLNDPGQGAPNGTSAADPVVSAPVTRSENLYRVDLGNNVFLDMVEIPAGDFLMGEDEKGLAEYERECGRYNDNKEQCKYWADDSAPQHRVAVGSFLMGRYEVTQRQWRAVMGALPLALEGYESKFKGDDLPVVGVSWNDIQQFLQKLGKEYRLPSEAEWEYAARAGTTTAYAFGPEISPDIVNYDGNYPAGNQPKGLFRGAPIAVGSLGLANAWGLYDMHGNVWEWCADQWYDNYNGAPTDGRARTGRGMATIRVFRGGSWKDDAINCRSANRAGFAPGDRYDGFGFRLSRTLP